MTSAKAASWDGVSARDEAMPRALFLRLAQASVPAIHPGFRLEMYVATPPRYAVTLLDRKDCGESDPVCAVFIVPQGREHEFLFGNAVGQAQLAGMVAHRRLLIVALVRGQTYGTMAEVQHELSPWMNFLAPRPAAGGAAALRIPFTTTDDGIGARTIVYEGLDAVSGERMLVEDVIIDGATLRRLVFASNLGLIQSEVPLDAATGAPAAAGVLTFGYQKATLAGMLALGLGSMHAAAPRIGLIGLGGGSLGRALHGAVRECRLNCVELDSSVARIASDYFGLVCDERLALVIADGLEFVSQEAASAPGSMDALIVDVNATSDAGAGLSCPPAAFVGEAFVRQAHALLSSEAGMFVLNLVTRVAALREEIVGRLVGVFDAVYALAVPGDVNLVLFCLRGSLAQPQEPDAAALAERVRDTLERGASAAFALPSRAQLGDWLCGLERVHPAPVVRWAAAAEPTSAAPAASRAKAKKRRR